MVGTQQIYIKYVHFKEWVGITIWSPPKVKWHAPGRAILEAKKLPFLKLPHPISPLPLLVPSSLHLSHPEVSIISFLICYPPTL